MSVIAIFTNHSILFSRMAFTPMELSLNIFGPVPPGGSFLNGFAILVIAILGLG